MLCDFGYMMNTWIGFCLWWSILCGSDFQKVAARGFPSTGQRRVSISLTDETLFWRLNERDDGDGYMIEENCIWYAAGELNAEPHWGNGLQVIFSGDWFSWIEPAGWQDFVLFAWGVKHSFNLLITEFQNVFVFQVIEVQGDLSMVRGGLPWSESFILYCSFWRSYLHWQSSALMIPGW